MNKLNVILLAAALLSGLAVVTVQDRSRQYYISLDKAEKHEVRLEQDYARLKLEQAKLSNHALIKEAAERQRLHPPGVSDTRMIEMK
ncbi:MULTISPECIES: cell division protein FtsL [unclassified Neisseria]|uniref:cell division protein FtsL n=1 Tax=unclassified Neisseria TaxID=2623750 RepID=UPI001071CDD6|nr:MULTISPECIES: cell division protein FtsL [unclassified Neisseria]MBF0804320.1 cell division protein FtsL [Neisseria sp. 19428wB4_WF04]TFU42899.1 cell division protein FtsL [Neisseria sp. WF04]